MRGICFQSTGVIDLQTVADPKLERSSDAIVQVEVAGLCGSDLHPFFGRESGLDPGTVMGHEMVGTIVDLGAEAKAESDLEVGDRVYAPFTSSCGKCFFCLSGLTARCDRGELFGWRSGQQGLQGCQAEWVRVPLAAGTLLKVPDSLESHEALLLGDNLSTGYFCAEMADIKAGGNYAVVGCGTVGQLCLQIAAKQNCGKLFAIDPVPDRRESASRWGAIPLAADESAVAEVMLQTEGRGVDGVMELVGLPQAQELAFKLLRPGGIISVIGCHCTPHFAFSPAQAYDKNLTYRTGRCSARHYMELLQPRVLEKSFDLTGIITHQFSPEDCKRAYEIFSLQRDGCIKAVFNFA